FLTARPLPLFRYLCRVLRLQPRSPRFPYTTLFRSQVAGHSARDLFIRRLRVLLEQRSRAHELARLAVAALRHIEHLPCELQRMRSEEHTSELQSRENLVCRLLLEKKDALYG